MFLVETLSHKWKAILPVRKLSQRVLWFFNCLSNNCQLQEPQFYVQFTLVLCEISRFYNQKLFVDFL